MITYYIKKKKLESSIGIKEMRGTKMKKKDTSLLKVYVDGSCRKYKENRNICGVGMVIKDRDSIRYEAGYLCYSAQTNNEVEYFAIIEAINFASTGMWLRSEKPSENKLIIYSDSKLAVNQINNKWKINKPELGEYKKRVDEAINNSKYNVVVKWIPREKNKRADELAQGVTDEFVKEAKNAK